MYLDTTDEKCIPTFKTYFPQRKKSSDIDLNRYSSLLVVEVITRHIIRFGNILLTWRA